MPGTDIQRFRTSIARYEAWLKKHLDHTWQKDLDKKHAKMRESAFVFLRATYWRWAETILVLCDDLADAPAVIGVGDIHLENYGVWRDDEGRLVWGVNDFDEAAEMPYAVDIVRLATSAILSQPCRRRARRTLCAEIIEGYRRGLAKPRPFTLDEKHPWLRTLLTVKESERRRFWKKMDRLKKDTRVPALYSKWLEAEMPGDDARIDMFARRTAGTGSLGRPRYVALATWRGGRLVREAKALVPSAWLLSHRQRSPRPAGALIANGRYRAPDPWYHVDRSVVVRRLSPNARKIEVFEHAAELGRPEMLQAMGYELANVHLGTGDRRKAIEHDLDRRKGKWLVRAAETAAEFVVRDFEDWTR